MKRRNASTVMTPVMMKKAEMKKREGSDAMAEEKEVEPSLERACSAAALEAMIVRINNDKGESKGKKEDRVSAVMGHFSDARGLLRNCGAYFRAKGGLTSEWLEESHALLFSAMFPSALQPMAILAVYEYSSLVVFFAAIALNADVEMTYEHAADWFGAIFM